MAARMFLINVRMVGKINFAGAEARIWKARKNNAVALISGRGGIEWQFPFVAPTCSRQAPRLRGSLACVVGLKPLRFLDEQLAADPDLSW